MSPLLEKLNQLRAALRDASMMSAKGLAVDAVDAIYAVLQDQEARITALEKNSGDNQSGESSHAA